MKHAWILLGLMIALLVVLGVVLFTPENVAGQSTQHSHHPEMNQGGSGTQRHGHLLGLAWVLGVLEIATFVCLLAFGARRRGGLGKMIGPFLVGALLYMGVFSLMILAYQHYLQGPDEVFLGPFPTPTAIMLFGLWPVPIYFVVLYVVYFHRTILTPEDVEMFQQLVAARRLPEENHN